MEKFTQKEIKHFLSVPGVMIVECQLLRFDERKNKQ